MYKLPDKVQANKEEFEGRADQIEQLLRDVKDLLVTEEGLRDRSFMEGELPNFKAYFEQVAAAAMAGKAQGCFSAAWSVSKSWWRNRTTEDVQY
jgi:hypothetical protein